jgi:hypothetical protein
MSCISTNLKNIYQTRLDKWEELLEKALTYYEYLLSTEGAESFKFDSGEASSWAKYSDAGTFQNKVIANIESWIDYYRNKVNGTGIVRLNLSRGR